MDDENKSRYDAQIAARALSIAAEQVAVRKLQKDSFRDMGKPKEAEEGKNG